MLQALDDIDLNDNIPNIDDSDDDEDEVTASGLVISKLRTLVRKIRKSPQMRQKLKKCCVINKMNYLAPIIDVKHRWNSTHDMITRAQFLRLPLNNLCSIERHLRPLLLTDDEWNELDQIQQILGKFKRATLLMCMEKHPVISSYLPTIDWLKETLEHCSANNPLLGKR